MQIGIWLTRFIFNLWNIYSSHITIYVLFKSWCKVRIMICNLVVLFPFLALLCVQEQTSWRFGTMDNTVWMKSFSLILSEKSGIDNIPSTDKGPTLKMYKENHLKNLLTTSKKTHFICLYWPWKRIQSILILFTFWTKQKISEIIPSFTPLERKVL